MLSVCRSVHVSLQESDGLSQLAAQSSHSAHHAGSVIDRFKDRLTDEFIDPGLGKWKVQQVFLFQGLSYFFLSSSELHQLWGDPDVWWCKCVPALCPAVDSGLHGQQVHTTMLLPLRRLIRWRSPPSYLRSLGTFGKHPPTFSLYSNFVSRLSNDFVLLLLNEAVGQLVVSSDSAVGGASVRLILAMANQEQLRINSFLLGFRGLWLFLNMKANFINTTPEKFYNSAAADEN